MKKKSVMKEWVKNTLERRKSEASDSRFEDDEKPLNESQIKKARTLPPSITEPQKINEGSTWANQLTKQPTVRMEMEEVSLSFSQKRVIDVILERKSVFFTGAAGSSAHLFIGLLRLGTGKSFVLKIVQEIVERHGMSNKITFTAPTGVAACNIRGLTIHSWAGIGHGAEDISELLPMVMKNRMAKQRWIETEILIIDEISMLPAELFTKLSAIGSRVRGDTRPFGGLQLVLCGDFYQLPPVGLGKTNHFCFESDVWKQLFKPDPATGIIHNMINLDKVYRQQNDSLFLSILNELRYGNVTQKVRRILFQKVQQSMEKIRQEELAEMQQKQQQAEMKKESKNAFALMGIANKKAVKESASIEAKITPRIRPTKLFSTNKDVDSYNATELRRLAESSSELFEYVAKDEGIAQSLQQIRSGCKAPERLELRIGAQVMLLKNLGTSRGLVNGARGTVVGFEEQNDLTRSELFTGMLLPKVKFDVTLGSEHVEEVIVLKEEAWEIKSGDRIMASRRQIPLMLAWAISIHKSQGMTIPLLEVSCQGMFEYGQAYVALSRATCLEGLTLRNFVPEAVKAHVKVREFYQSIQRQAQQLHGGAPGQQSIETTISVLMNNFQRELPKQEVVDDGWIDTRRNPAVMEATSQILRRNAGAAAAATGGGAASDGTIFGDSLRKYEYDEWLENPVLMAPQRAATTGGRHTMDGSDAAAGGAGGEKRPFKMPDSLGAASRSKSVGGSVSLFRPNYNSDATATDSVAEAATAGGGSLSLSTTLTSTSSVASVEKASIDAASFQLGSMFGQAQQLPPRQQRIPPAQSAQPARIVDSFNDPDSFQMRPSFAKKDSDASYQQRQQPQLPPQVKEEASAPPKNPISVEERVFDPRYGYPSNGSSSSRPGSSDGNQAKRTIVFGQRYSPVKAASAEPMFYERSGSAPVADCNGGKESSKAFNTLVNAVATNHLRRPSTAGSNGSELNVVSAGSSDTAATSSIMPLRPVDVYGSGSGGTSGSNENSKEDRNRASAPTPQSTVAAAAASVSTFSAGVKKPVSLMNFMSKDPTPSKPASVMSSSGGSASKMTMFSCEVSPTQDEVSEAPGTVNVTKWRLSQEQKQDSLRGSIQQQSAIPQQAVYQHNQQAQFQQQWQTVPPRGTQQPSYPQTDNAQIAAIQPAKDLTDEQKARIEANRLQALQRQQSMRQKQEEERQRKMQELKL